MEENAITVFVPVQDCSRTVFAETSDLQSNVNNFCSMRVPANEIIHIFTLKICRQWSFGSC